jgi:ESS family glutamate:Na+ symporter
VLLYLAVAIGFGIYSDEFLRSMNVNLPLFVHCLFYGMILTNAVPKIFPKAANLKSPIGSPTLAVVSDISLGLFMAMSLMSLQIWILIKLAIPLLAMLAFQVVLILVFTLLILFRALGKNYDAAVISAGYIGGALGATPIAMANMSAITKSYGPSRIAFIIIPIVRAFFIHLTNSFVIEFILNWMF